MADGGDEISDEDFDRALGEGGDAPEHGEDRELRDVPLDDDEAHSAS